MELRLLYHAIRRSLVLVAVMTFLGAVLGAAGWHLVLPSGWQASAVLVMDSTAILVPGQQPFSGDPERYVTSEMELLTSYAIAEEAAGKLSSSVQASDVRDALDLSHVTGTDVVQVVARADSADEARDIANAVASTYVVRREESAQAALAERRRQLDAQARDLEGRLADPGLSGALASALGVQLAAVTSDLTELSGSGVLRDATRVVDEARSASPARLLSRLQAVAGGAVAGGVLGVVVGVVRGSRRPLVVSRTQVESMTGVPVVAEFPRVSAADLRTPEALLRRVDEPVRRLAALVEPGGGSATPAVIAVCSAAPEAGTSTVWSALASWQAATGRRVLAVTLDEAAGARSVLTGGPDSPGRELVPGPADAPGWRWSDGATAGLVVSRHGDPRALPAGDVLGSQPDDVTAFDVVVVDVSSIVVSPTARSVLRAADHVVLAVPLPEQSETDLRLGLGILERETKADVHVVATRP
ncbi:hypothetical protein [Blastococcus sp. VKM Ac-2987]|uniref:hypothetical protein n=1 Tax=Blastococcus sp. VKM Ac-2987 TaxID=3004141 RepID=UPI0022AB59FC|nr:hypothetical protein [Blastococcus sp. VKM Ac-2987]MCZ2858471.1 hypothetical protein [Blastococcus sp. VKM Ac-2987]